jgi:hypothetical protein
VIGFQISAACLGAAGVPGLTGVLAKWAGLDVIAPVLVVTCLLVLAAHEAIVRAARPRDVAAVLHPRPERRCHARACVASARRTRDRRVATAPPSVTSCHVASAARGLAPAPRSRGGPCLSRASTDHSDGWAQSTDRTTRGRLRALAR